MNLKRLVLAVAALFGCALLTSAAVAAPAQPAAPAASAPAAPAPVKKTGQNYVLGSGDVIELKVLGRTDFDTRARIAEDGTIQVPYLGTITVKDRTADQLGEQLGRQLDAGGFYSKPIVKVDIVSFASRYVTVLGEVAGPGLIPIDRAYQLSEILARVGGIKESGADYVILRKANGAQQQVQLTAMATGDPTQDPDVAPGDKIFVPKAALIYLSGQVKTPGAYPIMAGMTLRMAIARAGGLTDLGTDHGVRVTGKDGKVRKMELNDPVTEGDVILIPEKLF